MSIICQTFIQNTWKKDLCSNCFKTLADHRYPNRERNSYILHSATPYHTQRHWSGTQEWKYLLPDPEKDNQQWLIPKVQRNSRHERERRSVSFLEEEPNVIGFGGEVYYLDEFDDDSVSDDGEFNLEKLDETDEDRAITKITKENTKFNTYISEKDVRKQARYDLPYNKPVTRTDDTYEGANRYTSKTDRRSRENSTYDSGNLYKAYYLPRVSIGPYGSVHNGSSHYGSNSNLDVQFPKKQRQNLGTSPLETTADKRRERQKSGDKTSQLDGSVSMRNSINAIHSLQNGEAANDRSLSPNNLPKVSSIDCSPSIRSDGECELLSRESENRIPNKVLQKCKEGINTISARQMRKNKENIERTNSQSLILDEPFRGDDSSKLTECANASNVLSQQSVLNGSPHSWSENDTSTPAESPSQSNATEENHIHEGEKDLQQLSSKDEIPSTPTLCEESSSNFIQNHSELDLDEEIDKPNQSAVQSEHEIPTQHSLHYAVSAPISHNPTTNHYAESWIAVENSQSNQQGRQSTNMESKLAALAMELEQARYSENGNKQHLENPERGEDPKDKPIYQTPKLTYETKEESQKNKKSKFSLKKFLKRGKDTDSDGNSRTSKSGECDRSTLRLKIVHPMDMIDAYGFNNPSDADNGSIPDVRSIEEDNDQCSKQSASTSIRGKKSERPSQPPPPPKCQQASSNRTANFVDLTLPIAGPIQQNKEAKSQIVENHYDVPKNVIPKSESTNKLNCQEEAIKPEPSSPDEITFHSNNLNPTDKSSTSDTEVIYDVARFPAKSKDANPSVESKAESLTLGEIANEARSLSESPQPNSDESKKSSETGGASTKQTQKAWISLEHSYAVVTAANHEVLARFLDTAAEERGQQLWKPETTSLQWSDFELAPDSPVRILDDKVVVDATFRHGLRTDVTLLVTNENLYPVPCGKGESTYPVLGYFVDCFPHDIFSEEQLPVVAGTVTTVHVLQRAEMDTFQGYCSSTAIDDNLIAERTFIILQLIHLLKVLRSRNIQELPDLCNTFLTRATKEESSKLILLIDNTSRDKVEKVSLCQFALSLIKRIFQISPKENATNCLHNVPNGYRKIFSAVIRLLAQEKPFSLQQTQCFVEYALWGPTTVVQNCKKNLLDMDVTLQRWLDTERAKCLRSVVRTLCRANVVTFLSLYEEYHADFLLRTSVRSLREVAIKS